MKTTLLVFVLGAVAWGGPLPACTSSFQYTCAQGVVGGYYVLTPFSATGSTEITGFTTGGTQVYDATIPSPPNGPGSAAVQWEIGYASDLVAVQSGQAGSLPACASGSTSPCLAANPGGVVTEPGNVVSLYIPRDTALTQTVDQYSTTLNAKLNGSVVSTVMLNAGFGSVAFQSAVLGLDSLLMSDGANSPSAPWLTSGTTGLQGSQTNYTETANTSATGLTTVASQSLFGPAFVLGNDCGCLFGITQISAGQLDINITTTTQYYIDRTVTTTNTYLVSQTYEIDGFTSTTPEPGSFVLVAAGIGILLRRRVCGRGKRG